MQASKQCDGKASAVLAFSGRAPASGVRLQRVGETSRKQARIAHAGGGGTATRWIACVLVACGLFWAPQQLHAGENASEHQIKAALLYRLAQFVEWPAQTFADQRAPLVIGVLGEDPFGSSLDDLARVEKVAGRPLGVRRYGAIGELDGPHVLFISKSEEPGLEAILKTLKNQPILTTSDIEGFVERGGMIGFVTQDNRIPYEVNLKVARQAGLTLSSQLLRLAIRVIGKPDQKQHAF